MICFQIPHIMFQLRHAAFQCIGTLHDAVVFIHLFLKLAKALLRQLTFCDDAQQTA